MNKLNIENYQIKSKQELRELVGEPHEAVAKKSIAMVDDQAKSFIGRSPLVLMSTSDEHGRCDVTPRGDYPGFVHVVNSQQLVMPERPGNRRVDSLQNIIENPHVGMLFIIPGLEEVLRVNGRAAVIKEHPILEKLKLKNKAPLLGIAVEVEDCFIHCSRALKHSGIWEQESWPDPDTLPSAKDIFYAHLKINGYDLK